MPTQSGQENALNFFYKQFPEGVLHISNQGNILGLNQNAQTILGWSEEELVGQPVHEYLCPEELEFSHQESGCFFAPNILSKFINNPINTLPEKFERWWVKKDGVYIHLEASLFLAEPNNKETSCFIIFKDVSHLRFSAVETKRLSLFPELNPSPVLQLDEHGAIHYANASMTDMMVEYGFSNQGFANILPDNLSDITQACFTGKNQINIEKKYAERCFNWNFHLVDDDEEKVIQAYGLDISERKLYEKSLKDMVEMLETHSQQKSDFLSNMSHELRTPMSGILGMVNLLLETDLSDTQFDYLDKIQKSSDTLLMLINDILDLSKIEAGKLEINPETFNLYDSMYEIVNILEFQAKQKLINLELRIAPEIPAMLIGDPLRIRQIILNFLTNAIKFTPTNGFVCLDVEYEQRLDNNEICLYFAVDDTGIGIADDKQQYVFGKYQQAERSTVRDYGGTGLGLAICKELAELMSADIGLDSIKGEGSSFWLKMTLPIDAQEELLDAYYNRETNFFRKLNPLQDKRCLLLGGLATTNKILQEQLKFWGTETHIIDDYNYDKAISYLSSNNVEGFDFIFVIDNSEPLQLKTLLSSCDRLAPNTQSYTETIWVSINQYPDKEFIKNLQKLGFDAHANKPIHPIKLKNLLLECLKNKEGQQRGKIHSISSMEKQYKSAKLKQEQFDLTVLLVEDNIVNQKISKVLLEKQGCTVSLAINGQEAVEQFQNSLNSRKHKHKHKNNKTDMPFDLIFMDCHMPILSGFEASKKIREIEHEKKLSETTIVALTANTAEEEMKNTKEAGMNAFLSKPIVKDKLVSILSEISQLKYPITEE